nr:peptidase S10 [Novosphingobium sp. 9]
MVLVGCSLLGLAGAQAMAKAAPHHDDKPKAEQGKSDQDDSAPDSNPDALFQPTSSESDGTVTVEGSRIDYKAIAGTLVVHPQDWDDAAWRTKAHSGGDDSKSDDQPDPEAAMFYAAYFKKGAPSADRPITFVFNGGPGSSSVWLHIGAFGPRRVLTRDDSHTPAAPYQLVNNDYSLLDATDLVFVDAPGTGFGRIAGKDKDKAFYGVDADGHAFSSFIRQFFSKYDRWNSPKFLFGESYGTPRSAVVANDLETGNDTDINGVILLSQILNFGLSADNPSANPGSDEAYVDALPTYAATAWYHNRLPGTRPANLQEYLKQVEHFATTDYLLALQQGAELSPADKQRVAEQMSQYIGIPASYIVKADLRLEGGQFTKELLADQGLLTGRFDTRFTGPALDPLSKEAEYDPQSAAISSAYVSAFNDYVRRDMHYGQGQVYKPEMNIDDWDFSHQQPGQGGAPSGATTNVMPDLATAMKYNPQLKVMLNGGYFDLATPFYEGWYEMHHLPIPASLQNNIEYKYYESGHMVYAHEASLKQLHDNVAAFIAKTDAMSVPAAGSSGTRTKG